MNTKFKFISITILFSLIFSCLIFRLDCYAEEVNAQEKSDIYILVVKEEHNGQEIANTLKDVFPDINVEYKEEINVINLKIKDVEALNNIKNFIDENFKSSIEEIGNSFKIEIEPMMDKNIESEIISSLNKFKSDIFRSRSSSSSDNYFESFDAFIENESENELLNSSSSSDSYYESFRWDIDAVTDNRSTYDIEMGNHDVKVGIIDSGIDVNHPDLKANIVGGKQKFRFLLPVKICKYKNIPIININGLYMYKFPFKNLI